MLTSESLIRKISVYVTHPLRPAGVEVLQKHFKDLEISRDIVTDHKTLVEKANQNDIIVTSSYDKVGADVLDGKKLKFVSMHAAGINGIDLEYATKKGIPVSSVHVLADTCADCMIGLFLSLSRKLSAADRFVHDGKWNKVHGKQFEGIDMHHKTMGIIGAGHIGQALGRRAKGFDMNVIYNDIGPGYASLEEVLTQSDYIALCCPLTPKTHRMITRKEINLMKPTAVLGNIARGQIIDTNDLCDALENGTIHGAAIDVTDPEPLPTDHRLLHLPNVVISPHIGSATSECRDEMAREAAQHCVEYIMGKIPHCCNNPEVYNK